METENYFEEIDTSDEEEIKNTVGNIPFNWYEEYPHIGYTHEGQKIFKPAIGNELDKFLDKMENPEYWKTVKNLYSGHNAVLTKDEIQTIKTIITRNLIGKSNYEPWVDFFTSEVMIHPLINTPPSKRSFIPSLVEKKKVQKLVYAMRMGWIKPYKPKQTDDENINMFDRDLWKDENSLSKRTMNRISHYLPAPKPPLPNHVESYNPPVEYLFDEKEEEEWKNLDPEDRRINFIPQRFAHLRSVPAYENFIKERYQRCCELYLCPRVRKLKANIEKATDLLPHLPKPSDLRPFPINLAIVFQGHTGPVNCLDVSPPTSVNASPGRYLCSGSADCTVKIWESCTGRCLRTIDISLANPSLKSPITSVSWYPTKSYDYNYPMIAFSAGKYAFVCALPKLIIGNDFKKVDAFYTSLLGKEVEEVTANETTPQNQIVTENESAVDQIDGDNNDEVKPVEDDNDMKKNIEKKFIVTWIKPTQRMKDLGILFILKHPKDVTKVEWHRGGDYLLTVCAKFGSESIILNKISKKQSQAPFSKVKGIIQTAAFHPKAPILFVATQKYVKVYHLVQKKLSKILITSCKWVSSLAIHPSGDNLIVGTYDNRVVWFDLDLSVKPFKILKFHHTSVKAVAFHPRLPLFASASEDCSLVISHGMVYNDYTRNPLIVPVKILRGGHSKVTGGILDCIFHPRQPWIFSGGADSKIALYSY